MRTTIRIDEDLYRSAKARAAESGRTVSQLVEDAVRDHLRPAARVAEVLPPLPVFEGSGALPGVDLADPAALRDLMDEGTSLDARR